MKKNVFIFLCLISGTLKAASIKEKIKELRKALAVHANSEINSWKLLKEIDQRLEGLEARFTSQSACRYQAKQQNSEPIAPLKIVEQIPVAPVKPSLKPHTPMKQKNVSSSRISVRRNSQPIQIDVTKSLREQYLPAVKKQFDVAQKNIQNIHTMHPAFPQTNTHSDLYSSVSEQYLPAVEKKLQNIQKNIAQTHMPHPALKDQNSSDYFQTQAAHLKELLSRLHSYIQTLPSKASSFSSQWTTQAHSDEDVKYRRSRKSRRNIIRQQ